MGNLTQKELTALEEQLGFEQVLVRKFNTLADSCADTALKSKLQTIAGEHQRHYNRLLGYLN